MEAPMKFICILGLVAVICTSCLERVDGASACGKASPDDEAIKLAPCASAAQDANAPVSSGCCQQVKRLGQNPSCLCAVLLSDTAKNSGVKAEIAITIPKRCNFANRLCKSVAEESPSIHTSSRKKSSLTTMESKYPTRHGIRTAFNL